MKEQRDVFYGIALYICVTAIIEIFTNINTALIQNFNLPAPFSLIALIIIYVVAVYMLIVYVKKEVYLRWWVFIGIFIGGYVVNGISNYFIDRSIPNDTQELIVFQIIKGLDNIFSIFIIIFSCVQYKLKKRGEQIHSQKNYIWYGILLVLFIQYFHSVMNNVFSALTLQTLLPLVSGIIFVCFQLCITLCLFFYFARKKANIIGPIITILIIFVVSNFLPMLLFNQGYHYYNENFQVRSLVRVVSAGIPVLIYFISYIYYYRIENNLEDNSIQWERKDAGILSIAILASCTIFGAAQYFNSFTLSDSNYQRELHKTPSDLTKHFPKHSTNYLSSFYSSNSGNIFTTTKTGSSALKEVHKILSESKILAEYYASDTNIIYIDDIATNHFQKEKTNNLNPNQKNYYPVYKDGHTEELKTESPSLKIYVIDTYIENKSHLELGDFSKDELNYYSSGIYVSEEKKTVIYWVVF